MTHPVTSLILLVLATLTLVLATATGSTTWMIAGACFMFFSAGRLWRGHR